MKYSVNLFGIYQTEHTRFEVTDKTFNTDWEVGTNGAIPSDDFVTERDEYGNLFFNYKTIEDLSVEYEDNSTTKPVKRTITSIINHRPSKCNFWHFEIWWKNELGIFIEDFSKSPQRSAVSSIRAYLKDIAQEEPSNRPYVIEKALYEN